MRTFSPQNLNSTRHSHSLSPAQDTFNISVVLQPLIRGSRSMLLNGSHPYEVRDPRDVG